jgi:hypothetical protein
MSGGWCYVKVHSEQILDLSRRPPPSLPARAGRAPSICLTVSGESSSLSGVSTAGRNCRAASGGKPASDLPPSRLPARPSLTPCADAGTDWNVERRRPAFGIAEATFAYVSVGTLFCSVERSAPNPFWAVLTRPAFAAMSELKTPMTAALSKHEGRSFEKTPLPPLRRKRDDVELHVTSS